MLANCPLTNSHKIDCTNVCKMFTLKIDLNFGMFGFHDKSLSLTVVPWQLFLCVCFFWG